MLEARLGPNRKFVAEKSIYANCRRKAVQKAVQWYWKEFKGLLGSAHQVMTVEDPYGEVVYDDDFACNDIGNKYLDAETLENVIQESNGELIQDDSEGADSEALPDISLPPCPCPPDPSLNALPLPQAKKSPPPPRRQRSSWQR